MNDCRDCRYCKISAIDRRFDNCYHPDADSLFADIAVRIGTCGQERKLFEKRKTFFPKVIWADLASVVLGRIVAFVLIGGVLTALWYYLT